MILLIDNYDSFTYNLKQEIEILGYECVVIRNDQIDMDGIRKMAPERIVLSPGPGHPDSAGITLQTIKEFGGKIPIFGVCLGHQAIGHALGAKVVRANRPMHGKLSKVTHQGKGCFTGVQSPIEVARYHSLVVDPATLPKDVLITARSEDGAIMGLRHEKLGLEGVQFHPESIATVHGRALLKNFLEQKGVAG